MRRPDSDGGCRPSHSQAGVSCTETIDGEAGAVLVLVYHANKTWFREIIPGVRTSRHGSVHKMAREGGVVGQRLSGHETDRRVVRDIPRTSRGEDLEEARAMGKFGDEDSYVDVELVG